jgi:hypothetical protein
MMMISSQVTKSTAKDGHFEVENNPLKKTHA